MRGGVRVRMGYRGDRVETGCRFAWQNTGWEGWRQTDPKLRSRECAGL